jgi:hypothetical protein
MSPVLTIKKLFMCLALILASAIVADPIKAQPVGGPTTGGNDPTGGNTTGGNTTGGNTGGGNVNTGGNVGVNVGEERRYIVEFDNFIVLDETGCDSCGSDEPQFIIRTADYALVTSEYDEADSGYQPWPFDDTSPIPYEFKRCAVPARDVDLDYDHNWECDRNGKAAPLSFTIAAWENDGDLPFTGFCAQNLSEVVDRRAPDIWLPNASFCVEGRGELIGKKKVELSLEDLSELQQSGQSFTREVDLVGGCDATKTACNSGGAPHYRLRYVVKRVPDAAGGPAVDPNP